MTAPPQPFDLLVVATHPDDAEISVGGTIVRCVRGGMRVGILDLTSGEPTPHGSLEVRARETSVATAVLGVAWRENLGLPNRNLEPDLECRRALAGVFRLTRPRIIFAPYWDDAHPDHVAASALCDAARFWAKLSRCDLPGEPFWPPHIYYYWSIHLRIHPRPSFVFDISDAIDAKMHAIRCYESQFAVNVGRSSSPPAGEREVMESGGLEVRPTVPTPLDDIRDRARYWGWTIGTAYAEPFASREEIGLTELKSLL